MTEPSKFEFREIRCPACGGDSNKFEGWRGGRAHHSGAGELTSIVRCRACTHQFPNPMPFPKGDLNDLYVDAGSYFSGHDVDAKKRSGLELMAEFERRIGRKGAFLDVGCGMGENLWAARECGWDAEGVDPSTEFIRLGRERLGVTGRNCSLEEAEFPPERFDVIMMSSIIEHLYDPFSVTSEVARLLKPNGWFWFDAPNEDGLYMKAGNLYMRTQGKDWVVVMAPTFPPYHVQGFNPRSVSALMSRTGLTIREIKLVGGVCEQTGDRTLRKKIEHATATIINAVGRLVGRGTYMTVWAQKTTSR